MNCKAHLIRSTVTNRESREEIREIRKEIKEIKRMLELLLNSGDKEWKK